MRSVAVAAALVALGASYSHPAWTTAEVLVGLCAGLLRLEGEAPSAAAP
jgi:hypothetical protein